MLNILKAYRVPERIYTPITKIYQQTTTDISIHEGSSKKFEVKIGVRQQGDTLAPYLFVVVLDYVLSAAIKLPH